MSKTNYSNIILEIKGKIGIIYINRPKSLNSFGDSLGDEIVMALRELNEHPDTIITVLTGMGRFFSSGADVRSALPRASNKSVHDAEKKLAGVRRFAGTLEMMRSVVDHKKVFVLALNGPGVGGGAAWFQGFADIVYAAEGAWLQIPFNALGLVPENGSVVAFAQSMGVHRANDFLLFGKRVTVEELERQGLINQIFPKDNFHKHVIEYLQEQLDVNDGKAMLETKRLANAPLRDGRMVAIYNAYEALSERSVDGESQKRFAAKIKELEDKSKNRGSKL